MPASTSLCRLAPRWRYERRRPHDADRGARADRPHQPHAYPLAGQALKLLHARVELLEEQVRGFHGNAATKPMSGVARIAAERARQILVEGWTIQRDQAQSAGELASAACCYVLAGLETPDIEPD